MNTENRDFVIERLERQLKEKEAELDDIKTNLRESILREIRSDLKNDLDFNNRIAQLERKVQSISSNLNGIMDELLDQKSMIRSLKEVSVSKERKVEPKATPDLSSNLTPNLTPNPAPKVEKPVSEAAPVEYSSPRVYRPEPKPVSASASTSQLKSVSPSSMFPPSNPSVPKEPASYASQSNPKVSIRSAEPESISRQTATSQPSNMRFNVREVPSVKRPEMPEPEPRSEYIIAETDDERQMRINRTSRQERDSCSYIVAEEDKPASRNDNIHNNEDSDYDSIEARESEDAVIMTTTRRK
ncbi:hypothetical protein RE474_05685 [Methanolobus sediminis]|uniref:Uncharacterized protein n=1 Tax=Methanolobus sediminis TaxID=3072978 RepID=A0AA51YN28_9EURY|nr:hypothetical protein [Methanolobus sediminis]WMW26203.1 hypothetical protein RE474_05685 [Methanolobus sediminis]